MLLTIFLDLWEDGGFQHGCALFIGFQFHPETSNGRLDVNAQVRSVS